MKNPRFQIRFHVLALGALPMLVVLSGCPSEPLPTAEEQADAEIREPQSALGKSVDKGVDFETDSNIAQINNALTIIKQEGEGAPATLEDAKRAVKVPETMWVDNSTGKPLVYDPATGTVSR